MRSREMHSLIVIGLPCAKQSIIAERDGRNQQDQCDELKHFHAA